MTSGIQRLDWKTSKRCCQRRSVKAEATCNCNRKSYLWKTNHGAISSNGNVAIMMLMCTRRRKNIVISAGKDGQGEEKREKTAVRLRSDEKRQRERGKGRDPHASIHLKGKKLLHCLIAGGQCSRQPTLKH